MKRFNREILGNIALTVGLVVVACVGLVGTQWVDLRLDDDNRATSHKTTQAVISRGATRGGMGSSWVVPNIARPEYRGVSRASGVRQSQSAEQGSSVSLIASSTSHRHSPVVSSIGVSGGSSVGGSSVGGVHRSSGSSSVASSGSFGSIPTTSMTRRSATMTMTAPFANEDMPSGNVHTKVSGGGGKDEPAPEIPLPVGDAVWPLLLCGAAYAFFLFCKKKAIKNEK